MANQPAIEKWEWADCRWLERHFDSLLMTWHWRLTKRLIPSTMEGIVQYDVHSTAWSPIYLSDLLLILLSLSVDAVWSDDWKNANAAFGKCILCILETHCLTCCGEWVPEGLRGVCLMTVSNLNEIWNMWLWKNIQKMKVINDKCGNIVRERREKERLRMTSVSMSRADWEKWPWRPDTEAD
jgi:hypothetical protein